MRTTYHCSWIPQCSDASWNVIQREQCVCVVPNLWKPKWQYSTYTVLIVSNTAHTHTHSLVATTCIKTGLLTTANVDTHASYHLSELTPTIRRKVMDWVMRWNKFWLHGFTSRHANHMILYQSYNFDQGNIWLWKTEQMWWNIKEIFSKSKG